MFDNSPRSRSRCFCLELLSERAHFIQLQVAKKLNVVFFGFIMAEFLEDPSILTKDKLKNELAANNVPLPSGEHKKEVYVQLYLKNLTAQNSKKNPPADTFSSDEELPAPVVSNKSRSGRVSVCLCVCADL